MAKDLKFTADEVEALRQQGLVWRFWVILQRLPTSIIVKNYLTGEVRLIDVK